MEIEIVTPSRKILSQPCDEVYLPGPKGEFGILPGHAPFVSTLGAGEARLTQAGSTKKLAIQGGFVQVLNNQVIVLADQCVFSNEVNKISLEQERGLLEKKLVDSEVSIEERDQLFKDRDWLNAKNTII